MEEVTGGADSVMNIMDPIRGSEAVWSGGAMRAGVGSGVASSMPLKSSLYQALPTRLDGCADCILAYTVSANARYSVLTVAGSATSNSTRSSSSSSVASAGRETGANLYVENNLSSFAVSLW